jgi:hypothetical protein
MAVDTKSMRDLIDAAPGDRMALEKNQIRSFLDAVDLGRIADQLAGMSQHVRGMAIPA